jgi:hypothetical protein
VIRVSTGTGFAFETRVPRVLARDFSVRSTVDISYKEEELEVLERLATRTPIESAPSAARCRSARG